MNLIFKFIRKEKWLTLLVLISIFTSITINFPLLQYTEKWKYGYEFGKYCYDISIGIIVSWIFYFIVVFRVEEQNIEMIKNVSSKRILNLIFLGIDLTESIYETRPRSEKIFPPTKETIKEQCLQINPLKSAMVDKTWQEFIIYYSQKIKIHISYIANLPHINNELKAKLFTIEQSTLMNYEMKILPKIIKEDFFNGKTFIDDFHKFSINLNELILICKTSYKLHKIELEKIDAYLHRERLFDR
jgi:hypothetical protein